jgi:hypothetical protein
MMFISVTETRFCRYYYNIYRADTLIVVLFAYKQKGDESP